MRTKDRYTYILTATSITDGSSTSAVIHPSFPKFSIKDRKESESWIYRRTADCNMQLCGNDALVVINSSIYTRFTIDVKDVDGSIAAKLQFKKTDCEIDVNHTSIRVNPYVEDDMLKLSDGLDNEYNLVDIISPDKKHELDFLVRPNIQIYTVTAGGGDTDIHLYSHVGHFKSTVTPATEVGLIPKDPNNPGLAYRDHFGVKLCFTAKIYGGYYTAVAGNYVSNCSSRLEANGYMQTGATATNGQNRITLLSINDPIGGMLYFFRIRDNQGWLFDTDSYTLDDLLSLTYIVYNINHFDYELIDVRVYAVMSRIVNDAHGYDIVEGDIYPAIFRKSYPAYCIAYTSKNTSLTDTGYGRVGNTNEFYAPPDNMQIWIPLYQESWHNGMSVWLADSYMTPDVLSYYSSEESVADFYSLTDAIRAMLAEIDSSIMFLDDAAHSQFLNSPTNPVTGLEQGRLYITQKSNLLNLHYDYPAWKAPCKLQQVFTLLRNAFNCYYDVYVDANGQKHLRIEHLLFYMNGYGYTTSTMSLLNLNGIQDGRNLIPFSFLTNRWKYKTDSQPIRYEFSWMDTQSEAFAGFPIIVPEKYRIFTSDKKEDRAVDWFSTDFDFLLAAPSECSSDGFVLAETENMQSKRVTDIEISANGKTYTAQNGRCAFMWLHPHYMPYGFYSDEVLMNNEETPVVVQIAALTAYNEVSFRVPSGVKVTPMSEIVTECGAGVIEELDYDMTSSQYRATLNYDKR